MIFRLLYSLFFPVNLAGDEAYYWDWGRRLDIGYYSKPPFIAWLYAFVDWIGSGGLFGIRAVAVLIGAASLSVLYFLTRSLFDETTAWIAVVLGIAAPANSALSFFLTIDAPLVFFWSLALWMFWRYTKGTKPGVSLLVLFLALALGHLTKQMMMIFPLLAIIFLVTGKETRPVLKRPILWLVMLGSYLSLIPPLLWNANHDWITFQHTGHHFHQAPAGEGAILWQRIEDFFSFLGTQLGVLSPAIAFLLFCIALAGLKHFRRVSDRVRLLLVYCGIPVGLMLVMALRQPIQPNWLAVFYVSGVVLTAAWLHKDIGLPFPPDSWRRFCKGPFAFKVFIIGTTILLGYFYFGSFLFQAMGKSGHKADPNRRLAGHNVMAAEFQKIRESVSGHADMFIASMGHRDLTSHLAFNLPDQPRAYLWSALPGITSQYDLWPNPAEDGFAGKDGLILTMRETTLPKLLTDGFKDTKLVGEFGVTYGFDRSEKFYVFHVSHLKFWPKRESLSKSE